MKIAAVDFGDVRTGLAFSDLTGFIAGRAITITAKSKDELIEKICGIKVSIRHGVNAGAVGAAMLAGIGAGIYKDEADANRICNERR